MSPTDFPGRKEAKFLETPMGIGRLNEFANSGADLFEIAEDM